jgi:hypothetical protein
MLRDMEISKIIEKSTLKRDEKNFILKLFDIIGLDFASELFEDIPDYIDDNTLNQLKEIAISHLEGEEVDENINEFITRLEGEKLLKAQKTLAFAKSLNNRTVRDSLLEHLDVDLLIKIGEILGSFLNFNPKGPIIKEDISVVIHALVKKTEKNGNIGIVESHRSDINPEMGGRYKVKFRDGTYGLFLLKNMMWSDPEYFIEIKGISKGGGKRRKKSKKMKSKRKQRKRSKSKRKRSKRSRRR